MTINKQTGFTLVELIMVIVMLGILSATALPKFFEKNTFAERAFFADTLNALRYAQKLAVATHCDVQVSFPSDPDRYELNRPATIEGCNDPTSTFDLPVMHPSTGVAYKDSEPGVSISGIDIVFYAKGDASVGADGTDITVAGKTITVVKETGFVYGSY